MRLKLTRSNAKKSLTIFDIHDLFSMLCNDDAELTPRLKFAQGKRECGFMKLFIGRSNYHLTIGL